MQTSNSKIVGTEATAKAIPLTHISNTHISNTHLHNHSLFWLGKGTSIKSNGVQLLLNTVYTCSLYLFSIKSFGNLKIISCMHHIEENSIVDV